MNLYVKKYKIREIANFWKNIWDFLISFSMRKLISLNSKNKYRVILTSSFQSGKKSDNINFNN